MDNAELEFVARLRDEASAAARGLRRTLGQLTAPVRGLSIPVDVAADAANAKLAAVNARLEGLEKVSRGAGRGVLALGRFVGTGAVALGALGGAGLLAGLKTAAGMENADIAFTTMLGSARKAGRFLDDLRAFAAKTPFEFPELQTAASSLISAGIQAKKVIPIMTTLGDVTSGMGTGSEGVQRATIALQQMSAAGRITGEDLNQLRDAGVPVFDLLAAATGKSKAEVVALAQAGKLGSKELGQLMHALETGKGLERFSGLMDKQSESLSGVFSTLKDNANLALAGLVTPAIPAIKAGMSSISGLIARGGEKLPGLIEDFRSVVASVKIFGATSDHAAGSIANMLGVDPANVERVLGVLRDLGTVLTNALLPALRNTSGAMPAFLAPLGLARIALGFMADHTTATKVALTLLAAVLVTVVPAMKAISAATSVASAAKTLYALVTGRAATAEQLATRASIASAVATARLRAMYAAETAATIARTVATKAAAAASKVAAVAQYLLNAAMNANPIAKVIAVIALLVAGFILAYNKSETFRNIVNGALKAVQVGAGNAVGFMIDGFRLLLKVWLGVADGIISGAAAALGWIPGLGGKLKRANAAFDRMREGIDSTLAGIADDARGWGEDVGSGMAAGIRATTGLAVGAAGDMSNAIQAKTRQINDSHSPSRVFAKLGLTIPQGFAKGIKDGTSGAVAAVKALADSVRQLVEDKKLGKGAGDAIVALIRAQNDDLKTEAGKRERAVARLEQARSNLADLLSSRDSLAGSTSDAASSFGSIGGLDFDTGGIDAARSAASQAETDQLDALKDREKAYATLAAAQVKGDADAVASATDDVANAQSAVTETTNVLAAATAELARIQAAESVTGENIARKLDERRVSLESFAASIETLRSRGLNEAAIQDLVSRGAEAGSAAAAALATSSEATIAEVNATAATILADATALGESTAQAMYGTGIAAAQGMVRGIVSEVESIDRAAKRLARRLVRAIRRELGIHSPSSVMRDEFGFVPAGAALGILDGIPVVDAAAAKLGASAARAATAALGGSMIPTLPGVTVRATDAVVTIRHEITSPDGSVSDLDARTIADMIARDPKAAAALEGAVATARNRRETYTVGPSA